MKPIKALFILLSLAALLLAGAGCSKLTKQNYDRIKPGMEYKEVTGILGDAATCDAVMGVKNCTWGNEQKNIAVKFVADQVIFMTCKGI